MFIDLARRGLLIAYDEELVLIFIIKYGRIAHWKVLLTTDSFMTFTRVF